MFPLQSLLNFAAVHTCAPGKGSSFSVFHSDVDLDQAVELYTIFVDIRILSSSFNTVLQFFSGFLDAHHQLLLGNFHARFLQVSSDTAFWAESVFPAVSRPICDMFYGICNPNLQHAFHSRFVPFHTHMPDNGMFYFMRSSFFCLSRSDYPQQPGSVPATVPGKPEVRFQIK